MEIIEDFTVVYDCGSVTSPQNVEKCVDYLRCYVKQVDVLFISHFDIDHVNSIRYLLNSIRVRKAVTPVIPGDLKTVFNVYTNGAYNVIIGLLNENEVERVNLNENEEYMRTIFHGNIWEWVARSMMDQKDFVQLRHLLQIRGLNMDKMDDADYVEKEKKIINDAFKDEFGTAGPNGKGLIVLSQRCQNVKTKTIIFLKGICCNRISYSKVCIESSCLYVGDANLRNRGNNKKIKNLFLQRYSVKSPLLLMQIPHHGSHYNIGAGFETDFAARYYFVNDINTKRIQKNVKLYTSLTNQNKLILSGDSCHDFIVSVTKII